MDWRSARLPKAHWQVLRIAICHLANRHSILAGRASQSYIEDQEDDTKREQLLVLAATTAMSQLTEVRSAMEKTGGAVPLLLRIIFSEAMSHAPQRIRATKHAPQGR